MRPASVPNDPRRRQRIVDAAIEVIEERGISAVTARAVAARADVPLGSVTYYFSSVSELLLKAAEQLMTSRSDVLDRWLATADASTAVQRLAELVHHQVTVDRTSTVVAYELHVLGLRDERFRSVGAASVTHLRNRLRKILPPNVADRLAATADGYQLQCLFERDPGTVKNIEALFASDSTESAEK